jgi:hypothetical protein
MKLLQIQNGYHNVSHGIKAWCMLDVSLLLDKYFKPQYLGVLEK